MIAELLCACFYFMESYLTFIRETGSKDVNGYFRKHALYKCICGKEVEAVISYVKNKRVNSCGCIFILNAAKNATTHGLVNHPLYRIWDGMKRRCNGSSGKKQDIKNYFEKGIKVCDEWINDFEKFYNWAITNHWQKGLQIDRINNGKGYSPDNCRFVTPKINMNNRSNNHPITVNGITKNLTEWSELHGVPTTTICDRIKRGWTNEKAVLHPVDKKHSKQSAKVGRMNLV